MAKQDYGTIEDVKRLIRDTKGDDAGLVKTKGKRPAEKKKTAKKKK